MIWPAVSELSLCSHTICYGYGPARGLQCLTFWPLSVLIHHCYQCSLHVIWCECINSMMLLRGIQLGGHVMIRNMGFVWFQRNDCVFLIGGLPCSLRPIFFSNNCSTEITFKKRITSLRFSGLKLPLSECKNIWKESLSSLFCLRCKTLLSVFTFLTAVPLNHNCAPSRECFYFRSVPPKQNLELHNTSHDIFTNDSEWIISQEFTAQDSISLYLNVTHSWSHVFTDIFWWDQKWCLCCRCDQTTMQAKAPLESLDHKQLKGGFVFLSSWEWVKQA